ncbi:MAG: zinc ribbon domain-containing protein, partial [Sciscionella sp.]
VQAILDDPSRRHAPLGAKALLTGIALCGVCSGPVHAGGTTTGHRSYRCKDHYGHFGRRAQPVDDYVSAVAVARLAREDAADLLMPTTNAVNVAALRVEHLALTKRLETLAEQFAEGDLTSAQLRAGSERLRTRLGEVGQQMADAGRVSVLGPLIGAKDVKAVWDRLGTARQRGAIDTLMEVKLHPPGRGVRTFRRETVGIHWKQTNESE